MGWELSARGQKTLGALFAHPLPRNLPWDDVVALVEEIPGARVREGKQAIMLSGGGASVAVHRPHGRGKKAKADKGAIAHIRNWLRDSMGIVP